MIASFVSQGPEEAPLAVVARVAALFQTRLDDPGRLLAQLLPDPGLCGSLTFDHVGVMVPWGRGQALAEHLDRLGFRIVERFESVVVAGLLRELCGQPDLAVGVTIAAYRDDPGLKLEVFCPENADEAHRPRLAQLAPSIGHVAFRTLAGADFESACAAVQRQGFRPMLHGSNGNQRGMPGGAGVCLRYFDKTDCALGGVKLEIVSPLGTATPAPDGPACRGVALRCP